MEWQDDAILLNMRPQGEHAGLVTLFTPTHGKWLGRLSGAQSAKRRSWLTAGNSVQASWAARLEEQLGGFNLELTEPRAARVFDDPQRLLALSYLAALTDQTVTERLPLPLLYYSFETACEAVAGEADVKRVVVDYERTLLETLGYGLDMTSCAVTGVREDLTHISPNTGRAVSRAAAAPYADRLLALPAYWLTGAAPDAAELARAARVTAYFLQLHLFPSPRKLPDARWDVLK